MGGFKKLIEIQKKFACAKTRKSADRRAFSYRSAEDILEAFKEMVKRENIGAAIILTESLEEHGDRLFITSSALLVDEEGVIYNTTSYAELDKHNGGMSLEQATGAAVSYARKYALGGLLAIDNAEQDADAINRDKELDQARALAKERANVVGVVEVREVAETEENVDKAIKYCITHNLTSDEFGKQQAKIGKIIPATMLARIKKSLVR